MLDFSILAPDVDRQQSKMLTALLHKARLLHPSPIVLHDADWRQTVPASTRYLLSIGRAAIPLWHDFGLIRVDANHGQVFTHRDQNAARGTVEVMQLHHPGTALQPSFDGYAVRDAMVQDLVWWRMILEGQRDAAMHRPTMCAKCLCGRESKRRVAEHWLAGADGIGLCGDHWRKRGQVRRKAKMKRVEASKKEAQIVGQREMFAGKGGVGVVAK